jgi:hypothetical protein
MGLAVLLVEGQDVPLDADAIARLSELGITHLALVRDGDTAGLVVEGWAFDSMRSATAAAAALGLEARTLHPLVEMAVSSASTTNRKELR